MAKQDFVNEVGAALREAVGAENVVAFGQGDAEKLRGIADQLRGESALTPNPSPDFAGEGSDEPGVSRYIPGKAAFLGAEWVESQQLRELAGDLIGRYAELHHLRDFDIRVLWKDEGGGSKGRVLYGKCTKPSGMTRYFALCDWVIWLAADNCREAKFNDGQVEALLYHELKHAVLVGKDSKPGVVGHDYEVFGYEVFGDEILRYGFWNPGWVVQGRVSLDEQGKGD